MCDENLEEDCKEKCEYEEYLKVTFKSDTAWHNNPMLRHLQYKLSLRKNENLFIFFDMGSIILDIDDDLNRICIYEEFAEIYNNAKGETTIIRNEEIKGFIFEPKANKLIEKLLEDDFLEDSEEELDDEDDT